MSSRLAGWSLLTTEIVARSKHSSSKKLLLHKKLPKPLKGASKLTSFMLSLPYARTPPRGRKVFLLLRAHRALLCQQALSFVQGPWIVAQLPTASGNTVLQPSKSLERPSDGQQISWVPWQSYHVHWHWIYACIVDRRRSTERRLHFDSPTHTRVNSDSCVNDGYCLRHFSVDTAPSTYFSPFPSRTLPRSTRTMTDCGQLRSSISLPGYHVDFFLLSRSTSALNTLQAALGLWFILEEKETSTNRRNSKVSSHSIVNQSVRITLLMPVFWRSAASAWSGWRRDFLSNRKYRYRPHTQPDVENCWPCVWRSPVS